MTQPIRTKATVFVSLVCEPFAPAYPPLALPNSLTTAVGVGLGDWGGSRTTDGPNQRNAIGTRSKQLATTSAPPEAPLENGSRVVIRSGWTLHRVSDSWVW